MKKATPTEIKNNQHALDDPEGRLACLERQGLLRRPSAPLPREILMAKPPKSSKGASGLETLLAERRDSR
jgi:hypothetical protein